MICQEKKHLVLLEAASMLRYFLGYKYVGFSPLQATGILSDVKNSKVLFQLNPSANSEKFESSCVRVDTVAT